DATGEQPDFLVSRLLHVSLVPRHGARIVRGRCHGGDYESRVCEHKSRSGRTTGCGPGLHDFRAGNNGRWWVADERLAYSAAGTIRRWNLFSARGSIWSACLQTGAAAHRGNMEKRLRKNSKAGSEHSSGDA